MKHLGLWTVVGLLLVATPLAWGKKSPRGYHSQAFKSTSMINGDKLYLSSSTGSQHLLISGHDLDNKWLTLIRDIGRQPLSGQSGHSLSLPEQVQFFNKGALANTPGEQVLLLTPNQLLAQDVDTGVTTSLLEIRSLYRGRHVPQFRKMDFVFDINQDGLSDILLPDFDRVHLYIQDEQRRFRHYALEIDAAMRVFDSGPQYRPREPYLFDANGDGRLDVLFHRDGELAMFLQQADGSVAVKPRWLPLNVGIMAEHKTSVAGDDGRDRSDLTVISFEELLDLNNDQLPDVVVEERSQKGVFNISTRYLVHYGRQQQGQLSYDAEPDTRVSTKGVQFELNFTDINNDGLLDVYTPTIEVGIGTIIGGLLSGSADLDVMFYLMDEDQSYRDKPQQKKPAEIAFDLSSGSTSYPALQVADFNGDKLNDLLIQSSENKLKLYYGSAGKLFARKATKFSAPLPKNGALVDARDLNGDGKADLLFHYGNDDAADKRYELYLLLSTPAPAAEKPRVAP